MRTPFLSPAGLSIMLGMALSGAAHAEYDYAIVDGAVTVTGYSGTDTELIIPDTIEGLLVTRIGEGAFWNRSFTSVTIPDSVTEIGESVFRSCSSLASVLIPDGVTSIGTWAFRECTGLTTVTIGNGVTTIGGEAFAWCTSLRDVRMGSSVTSIGREAFAQCAVLTGVYFRGFAPSLGDDVFSLSDNVTVYYMPGTSGWDTMFGGRPAVLWNPLLVVRSVQPEELRLQVSGTDGIPVVVEAASSLTDVPWIALHAGTLTDGFLEVTDPDWAELATRFYRVRSP